MPENFWSVENLGVIICLLFGIYIIMFILFWIIDALRRQRAPVLSSYWAICTGWILGGAGALAVYYWWWWLDVMAWEPWGSTSLWWIWGSFTATAIVLIIGFFQSGQEYNRERATTSAER